MPVFSKNDISIFNPDQDRNALTRWQKKGYIQKIRNGYYCFNNGTVPSGQERFFIANRIYKPSYLSMESALSYYGFIPEAVFSMTSVSTKKTQEFKSPIGHFLYRNIKPSLFFGYDLIPFDEYTFKIANPERVLLDMLYFYPNLNENDDFVGLRLNVFEIQDQLNMERFTEYISVFEHKALEKRALELLRFIGI